MRFALIDETGAVSNLIALEDGSNWRPPNGFQVIPDKEGAAQIGGTYDGKEFQPAPANELKPHQKTERELIAALEIEIKKQQVSFDERSAALEARLDKIESTEKQITKASP